MSPWEDYERTAWQISQVKSVSDWCAKNRYMSSISSNHSGYWDKKFTPYLAEIIDLANNTDIKKITLCTAAQVGKTTCLENVLGYHIAEDNCAIMVVMPSAQSVKDAIKRSYKPMIDESPVLQVRKKNYKTCLNNNHFDLKGMMVYFANAGSPTNLSSKPCRKVILDETDKMSDVDMNSEADPVSLAEVRTNSYSWNKQIWIVSTPTVPENLIWKSYNAGDRRKYLVPCKKCNHYQQLQWNSIKYPKFKNEHGNPVYQDDDLKDDQSDLIETTGDEIKLNDWAYYQCSNCDNKIKNIDKHEMLLKGVWCPDGCEVDNDGNIIGNIPISSHRSYHLSALYSPFLTWGDVVAEWLLVCADRSVKKLQGFINSWLGEVFENPVYKIDIAKFKKNISGVDRGILPTDTRLVTAGVDIGGKALHCCIIAWQPDEVASVVYAGTPTWNQLEELLLSEWRIKDSPHGRHIDRVLIDSLYNQDEVLKFCSRKPNMFYPLIGKHRLDGAEWQIQDIERTLSGKRYKKGFKRFKIDTNAIKDIVAGLMEEDKLLYYGNIAKEFIEHMNSEHVVEDVNRSGGVHRYWKKRSESAQNHYFDAVCYATAAFRTLGGHKITNSVAKPVAITKSAAAKTPVTPVTKNPVTQTPVTNIPVTPTQPPHVVRKSGTSNNFKQPRMKRSRW